MLVVRRMICMVDVDHEMSPCHDHNSVLYFVCFLWFTCPSRRSGEADLGKYKCYVKTK